MIFTAYARALSQVPDPRFRSVLLRGIGLTFALLVGAYVGIVALIQWLIGPSVTLPWVGEVTWINDLLSFGSLLVMMFVSMVLMVPVASAMTSLFLDEVAQAVEDRHYPHLPAVQGLGLWDSLKDTVNFLGVMIGANVLALVLYLMFAPFALFIFWALNGFLLGREYFTLAAARRVGLAEAKRLRRHHFANIWAAGVLMAMPLSLPLVNLVIPILGAATFTHLYHMLAKRS